MTGWADRWTLAGISPDTPVCMLGDKRPVGRHRMVLLSDDDADTLAWVIEQGERRHEFQMMRESRRRWTDSRVTMVAGVLAGLAMTSDLLLNIVHLIRGGV